MLWRARQGYIAGRGAIDATANIAPTITSSSSVSVNENATLAHSLTANESVTWSIVGGADAARLELSGSTLRWLSNGTKDFEAPNDADTNNIYVVTVRATDVGSLTTDQTISVTVLDVSEVTYVTWDAATVTNVTLTGSNLVATNTATTSTDQGAHVAAANGKTTGKYYFEVAWTTVLGSNNLGIGVGTTASTYTGMGNGGTTGVNYYKNGVAYSNGGNVFTGSAWISGDVMGVAVDLDNRRIWTRHSPSGIWNFNAGYDPAANTGGLTIPAGTMVPFATYGGGAGVAGNVFTANFGASTFSGAVPSGFTAGWTI